MFLLAKKNPTPNQKAWDEEFRKLKNRVRDWKRKFHAIPDLPEKPKRITKKDIEKLKNFKWRKIGEELKRSWRKEYERQYEEKSPEVYEEKPSYSPPTEQDYYDNDDYYDNKTPDADYEEDEDGYQETVVSREEIEQWIEINIGTITVDRELDGVREQLEALVLEAADSYGNYEGYLNYLEENSGTLTNLAQKAMNGYKGKNDKIYQEDSGAVSEFATVLNLGRPLAQSQSERFTDEGWVSFDFND